MKNRPDFFINHQNQTKSKVNPCYGCTTETGRCENCHATCKEYIAWKEPPEPVEEIYIYEHTDKRNLVKGLSGGRK